MKTKTSAIILVLFCSLLTTTAQIFYKLGSAKLSFSIEGIILNHYLIIGIILYAIGAFLLIIAFKGGELSVLYPFFAMSYIWISIISPKIFLTDYMNTLKWVGVFVTLTGIILVGYGGRK
ncbi:hypothetical protein CL621_01665 [archaeon]|nr:hypothetical protein [archaeon]